MIQPHREMVTGESHYIFGRRYRLRVIEENASASIRFQGNSRLILQVRPGTSAEKREAILSQWSCGQMASRVPALLAQWEEIVGVKVAEWRIRLKSFCVLGSLFLAASCQL
jgi:predicted metal-dependent hydrolase